MCVCVLVSLTYAASGVVYNKLNRSTHARSGYISVCVWVGVGVC